MTATPWPTMLGIHVGNCEGSTSLVRTTRTLLHVLGGGKRRIVNWNSEIHSRFQQQQPLECARVAGRATERMRCLHGLLRAMSNGTLVFKTGFHFFACEHTSPDLLGVYRRMHIPFLAYTRPSAYQGLACGVRDCFTNLTGGESVATLVDANGRVVPRCRRFSNTWPKGRGVADAVRAGVRSGSKVRIVTTDAAAFCTRVLGLHETKRLNARVAYLQRTRLLPPGRAAASARSATFEELHVDANATRRAAKWASWLASAVPAVAAMPRARVEATVAAHLPPPPSPPLPPVSAQYEDPDAVYALATAGGCADATGAAALLPSGSPHERSRSTASPHTHRPPGQRFLLEPRR